MSNPTELRDRLRTSAVLIAVILGLLFLDASYAIPDAEGLWLIPLLLFFALGTAWDIASLIAGSKRPISERLSVLGTAIVIMSACMPMLWPIVGSTYPPDCPVGRLGWIVIGAVTAMFVILIAEMARYDEESSGTIERTCGAIFVSLYVGLPFALCVALRSLGSGNWGLAALLTTLAVTKSADAGAYFSGKALGKHKLIPRLSPGKTREGAVGGVVTATIVAFVCLSTLFPLLASAGSGPVTAPSIPGIDHPLWGAFILGPVLAISGMIGDLAESLVKRAAGAKDSGSLLPGLGGVWDVTDSLIAAIMPAFLCFSAGIGL